MNKKSNRKILNDNRRAVILSLAILLMSAVFSIYHCKNIDLQQYQNEARLITAEIRDSLEQGVYGEEKYPYIVFDLRGEVLYAHEAFQKKVSDTVNVQEMLKEDKSFGKAYKEYVRESFVLEQDGMVCGFASFLLPKEEAGKKALGVELMWCFLPFFIGSALSFWILWLRIIYCGNKILDPIRRISTSAKGIIVGDYDYEVRRIYETKVAENEMGDLIYSFELMRDELKNKQITEEALKKSQQELISCISHDLKTPLSTIKAYSEGLRDNIAKTEEDRIKYTRIIIEKTDLLIGMIQDLLKYSNTQLNRLEINRQEVYFNAYFQKVMEELELFVEKRGMHFSYAIPDGDRIVCMDEKRITEVFYNLVENSMKYRKEDGWISIEAKQERDYVQIRVKDNGMGILTDDIPYVFDRFYRAEKSRSSSIPGSGLGLSICKYIIEQHGGEIYCRSRKEEGCEIGFTL